MLFRNVALVSLALVAAASASDTNPTSDHVASLLARRRLSKEKADNKAPNLANANEDERVLQGAAVVLNDKNCPNDGSCPTHGWCDDKGKDKKCDKWENDAIGKKKLSSCRTSENQKCVKPDKEASAPAPADATESGAATSSIHDLTGTNVLGYDDLTLSGTIGDGENTSGTITGVQVIEPSRETDGNGAATGGTTGGTGSTDDGNNNGATNGGSKPCAEQKVLSLAAKGESPLGTDKKCDQDCDCQDGCWYVSAVGNAS